VVENSIAKWANEDFAIILQKIPVFFFVGVNQKERKPIMITITLKI